MHLLPLQLYLIVRRFARPSGINSEASQDREVLAGGGQDEIPGSASHQKVIVKRIPGPWERRQSLEYRGGRHPPFQAKGSPLSGELIDSAGVVAIPSHRNDSPAFSPREPGAI